MQVFARLHFHQSATSTFKGLGQSFSLIERLRRRCGRNDKIDATVIEFIHQLNEPLGIILVRCPETGDIGNEYGMKITRKLNIVQGRSGRSADNVELKPGDSFSQTDGIDGTGTQNS